MFNIQCQNKGCWEYQKPALNLVKDANGNVDFDKSMVHCSNCNAIIPTVTSFTKRSMYGMGQVKKDVSHKKAFAILCNGCNTKDQPIIVNGNAQCPKCSHVHENLTKPFLEMIKQSLNNKI